MENLETLNELYAMDTPEEQFILQNFYYRFEHMSDGEAIWKKIMFDKKQIVWINPFNGFSLAVPNQSGSFEQNFDVFKSIWGKLVFELEFLFESIKSHRNNHEHCCLKC